MEQEKVYQIILKAGSKRGKLEQRTDGTNVKLLAIC